MKSIVLEKHTASEPGQPIGALYAWTYVSSTPEVARHRAWAALKRDHPAETRDCWQETKT